MSGFRLTRLRKDGGALTKHITLAHDGTVKSEGSACVMSRGVAERIHVEGAQQLATLIGELRSDQAIALGALRLDLPDRVEVTTKRALEAMNGVVSIGAQTGPPIGVQKGPLWVLVWVRGVTVDRDE